MGSTTWGCLEVDLARIAINFELLQTQDLLWAHAVHRVFFFGIAISGKLLLRGLRNIYSSPHAVLLVVLASVFFIGICSNPLVLNILQQYAFSLKLLTADSLFFGLKFELSPVKPFFYSIQRHLSCPIRPRWLQAMSSRSRISRSSSDKSRNKKWTTKRKIKFFNQNQLSLIWLMTCPANSSNAWKFLTLGRNKSSTPHRHHHHHVL